MTGAALIDLVLAYWDNIDPTDADNTQRRQRVLLYLQMTVDEVRRSHPWPFALTTTTLTPTPGDSFVALPGDFDQISRYGGLYRVSDGSNFVEIPIAELQYARNNSSGDGLAFSIFDNKIQFLESVSDSFYLNYKKYASAVSDDDGPELEDAIPTRYHHTVILPGTAMRSQVSKGDIRDFERAYRAGLAQMVQAEMTQQTSVKQLPMHVAVLFSMGGS